jgi:hypothetical protein
MDSGPIPQRRASLTTIDNEAPDQILDQTALTATDKKTGPAGPW